MYTKDNIDGITFCGYNRPPEKGDNIYTVKVEDDKLILHYENYITGAGKSRMSHGFEDVIEGCNSGRYYVLNPIAHVEIY